MRVEYEVGIVEKLDEAILLAEYTAARKISVFHLTSGEMEELRNYLMRAMSPAPELSYTVLSYQGIPCRLEGTSV